MPVTKIFSLLFLFFLVSCSSQQQLKPSKMNSNDLPRVVDWGDWVVFPVTQITDGQTTFRNDYLMYRVRYQGIKEKNGMHRYEVQFKNGTDEPVRMMYSLYSEFERCRELEIVIGSNGQSQTIVHLFENTSTLFIELASYGFIRSAEESFTEAKPSR